MRSRTALLVLPTLASAVSLADLAPRAQNLPPACEAVYSEQVPGCTAHDFISATCTDACIAGLESLVQPIMQACGNQGVSGENLVVAFLVGVGPQQICHNAPPSSGSGPPHGHGPPGHGPPGHGPPGSPPPPPSTPQHPSHAPSIAPTIVTSGTSTASSAASTLSSLLVDTTPLPASSQAPASSSTRRPHKTTVAVVTSQTPQTHHGLQRLTTVSQPPAQKSSTASAAATAGPAYGQTHSGTGSPFDVVNNAASGGMAASILSLSLAAGLVLLHCFR